ncbi:hypothetical protein L1987_73825 [Smallanthus sonchifolius]|uniref:Uncharacterized protein n=1 Tax=Smallanthus sonchifolius TaxID=185202 RepID=A0ACB9A184_9ASTR|nr:hypothetical protein L1987_73825 [Smallanthus sonchifolius]
MVCVCVRERGTERVREGGWESLFMQGCAPHVFDEMLKRKDILQWSTKALLTLTAGPVLAAFGIGLQNHPITLEI